MAIKPRGGKLKWKRRRANHGRKPGVSLTKPKLRKSNK